MEIADIFVINKADVPGADKMENQLRAMLELGMKKREIPPVVKTVATEGEGIELLNDEIHKFISKKSPEFQAKRKKRLLSWMLKDIIKNKIYERITLKIEESDFDEFVERIYQRETDPYSVADEIIGRFTDKS
jgi:LAO/AO transport system kinase